MTQPDALTSLYDAIKKISSCNCHFLKDRSFFEEVPVLTNNSVGIAFLDGNISDFILNLRINNDLPGEIRKLPVICLGYRSMRSLIKSEAYPKLMAAQGLYYLSLPAGLDEIKHTLHVASKCEITDPKGTVKDLMPTAAEMSKIESAVIHDLGNFFGSERLLYGACFAGRINSRETIDLTNRIENIQNEESNLNKVDLELYRFNENRFDDELKRYNDKDPDIKSIEGNILLIDDLAHLGWSDAIAASLWGSEYVHNIKDDRTENGLKISDCKSKDGKYLLRSISNPDSKKEDEFIKSLKVHIEKYLTDAFDIVLLDLRLRRVEDEKADNPEKTSGIEILKMIRNINAAIPVIMLTASRRVKNMEKVFDLGADGYFVKETVKKSDRLDDIKTYYERFCELVTFGRRKSYLGDAWKVVDHIENNYTTFPVIEDELLFLRKAIAFLRKKSLQFEREVLSFDVIGEAILALNKIKELKIGYIKKSLDGGFLLQGLRNFIAHPKEDILSDEDAKIALYLAFRLFTDEASLLRPFCSKAFEKTNKMNLKTILRRSYAQLANIISLDYVSLLKDDCSSLYPGGAIYEQLSDNKIYHYLLFLCRLKNSYRDDKMLHLDSYEDSDKITVSYIFSKVASLPEVSTRFNGTLITDRYKNKYIEFNQGSDKTTFDPDEIQNKELRKAIKQNNNMNLSFDLTLTSYAELFAHNIERI
jgi:CheY-like chemotaxis protein